MQAIGSGGMEDGGWEGLERQEGMEFKRGAIRAFISSLIIEFQSPKARLHLADGSLNPVRKFRFIPPDSKLTFSLQDILKQGAQRCPDPDSHKVVHRQGRRDTRVGAFCVVSHQRQPRHWSQSLPFRLVSPPGQEPIRYGAMIQLHQASVCCCFATAEPQLDVPSIGEIYSQLAVSDL